MSLDAAGMGVMGKGIPRGQGERFALTPWGWVEGSQRRQQLGRIVRPDTAGMGKARTIHTGIPGAFSAGCWG